MLNTDMAKAEKITKSFNIPPQPYVLQQLQLEKSKQTDTVFTEIEDDAYQTNHAISQYTYLKDDPEWQLAHEQVLHFFNFK